jgi:hypothetical protein
MLLNQPFRFFRYSAREYLVNSQRLLTTDRFKTKTLHYSRVTASDNDKKFELHLRGAPLGPTNLRNPGFLTQEDKLEIIEKL